MVAVEILRHLHPSDIGSDVAVDTSRIVDNVSLRIMR